MSAFEAAFPHSVSESLKEGLCGCHVQPKMIALQTRTAAQVILYAKILKSYFAVRKSSFAAFSREVSFMVQWTLVNPDRVNPKPRKSEVQNQLINN